MDCASAIRLNPKNVKAFYRSSLALLALDKVDEALDACKHGLEVDPSNTALKAVSTKIVARKEALDKVAQKRKAEQDRKDREKMTLAVALQARNIRTRNTGKPPELEDAAVHLTPDPLSPESSVAFPVVLLYPLHAQSDFVKAFLETETVTDHLTYILPLPWDTTKDYTIAGVDCYMETISGGLIKLGKKVTLLEILTSGKVEVVDGLLKIHVIPRSKSAGWIEQMKARKKA